MPGASAEFDSEADVPALVEVEELGGVDGVLAIAAVAPTEARPSPASTTRVMVVFFFMYVFSFVMVQLDRENMSPANKTVISAAGGSPSERRWQGFFLQSYFIATESTGEG